MPASSIIKNQRTILIIDDDKDMLELNRMILERHGYRIVTAQNAKETLISLARIKPDLILLDYNLENLKGSELIKIIETRFPKLLYQVPLVFLTGQSEIPNTRAIGFIQKSSNFGKFLHSVETYIQRYHQQVHY